MLDLTRTPRRARILATLALAALATACTPFESLWRKDAPPPPPPPPAKPELPLAEATHRFVIAPGTDVVGRLQVTVARQEDTLPDIARRFNVGYEEIVRANPGVDPWLPGEGTEIVLPTRFVLPDAPREGVVINLPAMRLFYYLPRPSKDAPQEVITHPIGIGKVGWKTPEGRTKITQKTKDPTWTPPRSVRLEHERNGDPLPAKVPPGPDNPLGRHAMRLGWPTYLIHGTNKPYGVGMRASAGCIRLYPEDIEGLFGLVPVGTPVLIVNQPFLLGWEGEQLYVQAYDVMEDDERDWSQGPKALRKKGLRSKSPTWRRIAAADGQINWELAHEIAKQPRGIPVAVTIGREERSEALIAAAPRVRNALPVGATWDGNEDQYGGEQRFREVLAEREPGAGGATAAP